MMQKNLGFWDDFSLPDFELPDFDFSLPDFDFSLPDFDFSLPDFDFSLPDFDFSLPDFGFGDDISFPDDAFSGQYIDDAAIPDFDIDQFLASPEFDFSFESFDPGFEYESIDDFLAKSGEVGVMPSNAPPPVLDSSGSIVAPDGKSSGILDTLMKAGGQLMPVIKNLAGQFFAYQKSTNALTGRSQYTPQQISQMQAAQIAAQQRALQMGALNSQQAYAAQQYQQQLALPNFAGLSSQTILIIVGGIAALAAVYLLSRNK